MLKSPRLAPALRESNNGQGERERLRVLILSNFYLPDAFLGGVPTATRYLAQSLWALGHDVRLLVMTSAPTDYVEPDPFPITRGITDERIVSMASDADVAIVANEALAIIRPLARTRTPFVIVHHRERAACPAGTAVRNQRDCFPGPVKCWFCREPSLGEVNKPTFVDVSRRIARYALCRWYLRKAAANVVLSHRNGSLIRAPNSHLIANPIDPIFSVNGSENGQPESDVFRLTCVGRLFPEKNFAFAIRLLARLPASGFTLDIFGDGPERSELERLARQLDVASRVHFRGLTQGQQLVSAYHNSDLTLVPSDFEESFCLVAAESLACGAPVLASNRGALPQTVGPGGLCLPLTSPEAWLEKILQLSQDREQLARYRQAGVNHVAENYSSTAVGRQWDELLTSIVNKRVFNH